MDSEQRYLRDVGRLAAEDHELKTELSAREEEVAEAIEKRDGVKCRVLKIEQQLLTAAREYAIRSQHPTTTPLENRPIARPTDIQASATASGRSRLEQDDEYLSDAPRPRPQTSQARKTGQAQEPEPARLDSIHPDFPTVIYLKGVWTEMWCGRCGTNYNLKTHKSFSGVKGLHEHWKHVHASQLEDRSQDACLADSGLRVVSSSDAKLMRAGKGPRDVTIGNRIADDYLDRMLAKVPNRRHTASPALGTPNIVASSISSANNTLRAHKIPRASLTSTSKLSAPTPVKRSKRPASTSPPASARTERLTEYEAYQNLEAHAKADGTPRKKKKRSNSGRPDYRIKTAEELEALQDEGSEEWEISCAW
ncbi:hypothetical protein LTR48_002974 [Friedmanniomyces endolithicus]|uniref:Uncharacterized protein n=2 Tax=Dothideomycetidae TaxID=451867 RepID=A0A4U0V6U8_9PEZI|nr:hypothetical protein LTS09_003500 [Friedmanniomyces endolithicus]KAK0941778.1 hypothetical protein LTR29_006669 [Friedmanniomyces endolithicus]KAK1093107.1 hypothetical protein LTR48_002974 [Friedmanniomyces endolithicus]KAK5144307.1 hypothetical protein LTR32_003753 [Rachicladosporium monterosium]TKA44283.1 hypothetical protein B0A54_05026 [Friedmanniomyces endolithicus]